MLMIHFKKWQFYYQNTESASPQLIVYVTQNRCPFSLLRILVQKNPTETSKHWNLADFMQNRTSNHNAERKTQKLVWILQQAFQSWRLVHWHVANTFFFSHHSKLRPDSLETATEENAVNAVMLLCCYAAFLLMYVLVFVWSVPQSQREFLTG